ncbi:hypothetical protein ACFYZN_29645 [Streptomyces sp. NPDC001777]|uniref:hypothetical protein n=1 Tax=Streptomyces sp. NPDC001777 TaxID=3364608 RepID=UPI0036B1B172
MTPAALVTAVALAGLAFALNGSGPGDKPETRSPVATGPADPVPADESLRSRSPGLLTLRGHVAVALRRLGLQSAFV